MASQPTAPGLHPPPELPSMPDVSPTLTQYLRTFSLWCRNGFKAKLDAQTALPGIMLQAYDAPAGVAPNVFMLQINQAGIFRTVPMPLGSGKP